MINELTNFFRTGKLYFIVSILFLAFTIWGLIVLIEIKVLLKKYIESLGNNDGESDKGHKKAIKEKS